MTPEDEDRSLAHIALCRRINRRAAAEYQKHGVSPEDAAIAAIYSAHDLAMHNGKSPIEAIEWLRTALDLQERQLLNEAQPH